MIIFENILNGQTVGIDRQTGGNHYRSKLSAVMNSSNLSPNHDRGQDFGWRLIPEQQALIEDWESDPQMIDKVSTWSKVPLDSLTHGEFLAYLVYQQELGMSPEKGEEVSRRENQRAYEARVEELRANKKSEMPAFDSKVARGGATVDDFLAGDVTGDASGDKVVNEEPVEVADNSNPPIIEKTTLKAPAKTPKAKK